MERHSERMRANLERHRATVQRAGLQAASAKDTAKKAVERARTARRANEAARSGRSILQTAAAEMQRVAHSKIAEVVSSCFEAVFPDPYKFEIEFEKKRNKTEAKILFTRGDFKASPMGAAGGGPVDVASFALRLSSVLLSRPPQRRLLVLDEPFRFVSRGYRPRVQRMLEDLADELQVQIIMITHDPELVCGKVVRVGSKETLADS